MTAPLTAWFDHGTGNAGDEARGARAASPEPPGPARGRSPPPPPPPPPRGGGAGGAPPPPAPPPPPPRPRRDHPPGTGPGRPGPRPGRRVLARTDGAGGTKKTIEPLTRRRASCSVGVHPARPHTADPRAPSPRPPRALAYNADGQPREGAHVAETRRPAGPDRLAGRYAGQPCAASGPTRTPGRASRTSRKLPAHRPRHQHKGGRLPGLEVRHRLRTRHQKTASAARKTPGSTTSLRRTSRRTVSGA